MDNVWGNKNKKLPYYSVIIFQLILEIFILIEIIVIITEPIRYSRVLGFFLMILIGAGIIIAFVTIYLSINYWKDDWVDFNNFQFRICALSVIIGIIVGCFVLFTLIVP